MSYFVCPQCHKDNIEFVHDVRMIEYYDGDSINTEEDLAYERENDGFVSIECMECGHFTDDPFELDEWVSRGE